MSGRIRRIGVWAAVAVLTGGIGIGTCAEEVKPRPAWTTSRIQGSPEAPSPYQLVPAFPRATFQKPTSLEEVPGAARLLVTEMGGRILTLPKSTAAEPELVLDLREGLTGELSGRTVSLFDAALHPDFSRNGLLFVCYVHPGNNGHTRLSRFHIVRQSDGRLRGDVGSELVVITWPSGGHNGGCVEFGRDGYLYVSTGDGSGPNPPDGLTTGQDISDLLGAILRLDVDRADSGQAYAIPSDNPFVGRPGARGEIWAYGLRNPWKFGVDRISGDVFAADNGWETWEMVHRIVRGGNCGWPVMEGRAALRTEVAPGPTPILPPVRDHSHTEANSVIGGPVYRGARLPALQGAFVYGDYITGTIWSTRREANETYSHQTLVDTDQRIIAFAEGSAGELFVLDYDFTGQIYVLLPSDAVDRSAEFPRRLSETGLFASVAPLQPAPGVIPYAIRVEPWNDGADAKRWVAIPGQGRIQLAAEFGQSAQYPEGTVFVKHLTLPLADGKSQAVETQILHYERGTWRPYTYRWRDSEDDAELVESLGATRLLRGAMPASPGAGTERTWHYQASNECKLCHNAGPQFVLGFVRNQLSTLARAGALAPIQQLAASGVVDAILPLAATDPAALVDPHDPAAPLDARARSYLHTNCAMCHHPGGNAIVSIFLRRDLAFDQLNTNKGTGIGTFGMRDAKILVPGDPYRSVLMYRISKLGYARMPYIGSRVVDSRGVALIEQWIRAMGSPASAELSAPARADSPESQAIEQLARGEGPEAARRARVQQLLQSTEGALALAGLLHRQSRDIHDFSGVLAVAERETRADVRGLFETFVPESRRRTTLGPNADPSLVLSRKGDAERGKLIFSSDGSRCRNCHALEDAAQSVGPTLRDIARKLPQRSEILTHVLQSSLRVDDPYAAYLAVLRDGRSVLGLLVEQTNDTVLMRTAEKQTVRIARGEIEEMKKSTKSLMPDAILSDLTAQEAADLLEYITSLAPSGR